MLTNLAEFWYYLLAILALRGLAFDYVGAKPLHSAINASEQTLKPG